MQQATKTANEARAKQGSPAVELVGWASRPRYDKQTHKMYWAKELKFSDSKSNTLNYSIRVLGRAGVLNLNVVASMDALSRIEANAPEIVGLVNFTEGNRYADFKQGADKVAAYGLAALIAGGIAAKAGLFKVILVALLIHLGTAFGWFYISTQPYGAHVAIALKEGVPHLLAVLLSITVTLNLVLFCFNLLPVPPLDGSSLPLLFLNPQAAVKYSGFLRHPGFAFLGVILAYRLFPLIFNPIQDVATRILFP